MFIHVPFQLLFGAYSTATISALGTSRIAIYVICIHLHLSEVKPVRAKCIAQGHHIETMMS